MIFAAYGLLVEIG